MFRTLQRRLSTTDVSPQLMLLALLTGLCAGAVILLFRHLIDFSLLLMLPAGGHGENFEQLSAHWHFLLPLIGGVVLGLIWHWLPHDYRQVGVTHVMERLTYHQARLPIANTVIQFIGASLSIISGHSVGREGPGIHLGAGTGSYLGQLLHLPNNALRTLVACGTSAAIAASFNTPLAGVIFAMEVVMMEYYLASFLPVILAAVSATVLTHAFLDSKPIFDVPSLYLASLGEIPYIVIMGLVIGAMAALFNQNLRFVSQHSAGLPVLARFTAAGLITGMIALVVPQVMGLGYDSVNQAMLGQYTLVTLLLLLSAKLLATTIGLGLGLPGGLIGPTLVIGASAGGATALALHQLLPGEIGSTGFYAMIGVGAMMSATLRAPLAALIALLELTANPNIILPGMLAIVSADLVSAQLFKQQSVFLTLLKARGLMFRDSPVSQSLRRVGVLSIMNRHLVISPSRTQRAQAHQLLSRSPLWVIIQDPDQRPRLLLAADLARFLADDGDEGEVDLLKIPGERHEVCEIPFQASLQDALELLNKHQVEAGFVMRGSGYLSIRGIITRQAIESHYNP